MSGLRQGWAHRTYAYCCCRYMFGAGVCLRCQNTQHDKCNEAHLAEFKAAVASASVPETDFDERMAPAVALLGRTGAITFSIRYVEDDSGKRPAEPVAWVALVSYQMDEGTYWEAAGGMQPEQAVFRLCERMIDGGVCTHCQRPTGFDPDSVETMPMDALVCWYQFDPELETFRRGCEGDSE